MIEKNMNSGIISICNFQNKIKIHNTIKYVNKFFWINNILIYEIMNNKLCGKIWLITKWALTVCVQDVSERAEML
jgi:hypothetical protein